MSAYKCPIEPADRRLRDALYHWKKLEINYFHAESFRINLNSFIQEARNVTFVLQAQKGKLPGFESWYRPWQERLKGDPVMKWIVESRNRIAKQGDLEMNSLFSIEFITDWTGELTRRFSANPCIPTSHLIGLVKSKIPKELVSEESILCLERRWVDVDLPNHELLTATSLALRTLFDLIKDAHATLLASAVPSRSCMLHEHNIRSFETYPIELANVHNSRKVWVRFSDDSEVKYSLTGGVPERADLQAWDKMAKDRYGLALNETSKVGKTTADIEGIATAFLERAKRMLEVDGKLQTFIFARTDRGLYSIPLCFKDRVEKHIAIRGVAGLLEEVHSDWVVLIGEVWTAQFDASNPPGYRHAVDFPNRGEAISVDAISLNGSIVSKVASFTREPTGLRFGETTSRDGQSNILLPLQVAMKKALAQ